jgi:tRNA(Ile)-lysidine synthase
MSKKNSNVILRDVFKNYEDLSKIYYTFSEKLNSYKKKSLLIAVSGGPDSLALTALTKAYSYEHKCKIYYVLINHNIRKNSSREALSVKKLLNRHQIRLNIIKNNTSINKNIQSQAREIRYGLLETFCKKKKIGTILTAHNLEDQVETFFIRLSRGSGLHGLSSMKQTSKINKSITLARPLLDLKKIQLINISKIIFGKYYKDPTNDNTKYLRTRIRKFKKTLEKSGIHYDQIFKSIKNLSSSRDTLDFYFNEIYKNAVSKKNNKLLIDLKKFSILNQEMKMRVLNKSLKEFTNSYYSPRAKKTTNLIKQIEMKKNTKFTLAGCFIFKQKKHIIIEKEKKK